MRAYLLSVALLFGSVLPADAAGKLTVRIAGLKTASGEIAIALFDSSRAFDDTEPLRSEFLPLREKACDWIVEDLPPGSYAVKVYHDLNGNRELDRKRFGIPSEPFGFSNDARAPFGPPTFEDASFELDDEPRTLEIELRGGGKVKR